MRMLVPCRVPDAVVTAMKPVEPILWLKPIPAPPRELAIPMVSMRFSSRPDRSSARACGTTIPPPARTKSPARPTVRNPSIERGISHLPVVKMRRLPGMFGCKRFLALSDLPRVAFGIGITDHHSHTGNSGCRSSRSSAPTGPEASTPAWRPVANSFAPVSEPPELTVHVSGRMTPYLLHPCRGLLSLSISRWPTRRGRACRARSRSETATKPRERLVRQPVWNSKRVQPESG